MVRTEVARLLNNSGIVRNRLKIAAVIHNAKQSTKAPDRIRFIQTVACDDKE